MEKWQAAIDSCCVFLMARRNSDTDPHMEHLIPRIKAGAVQGILIALVVAGVLGFFSDSFVSKNTITEKQIETLTSTIEGLKTIVITYTASTSNKIDRLDDGINRLDKGIDTLGNRVKRIENTVYGTEGWDGE